VPSYEETIDQIDELFSYELDRLNTKSVAFQLYNSKRSFNTLKKGFLKTQLAAISESEAAVIDFIKNVKSTMKTLEKEANTEEEYADLSNIYWKQLLDEVDQDLTYAIESVRGFSDWRDEYELLSKLRKVQEDLSQLELDIKEAYEKLQRPVVLFVFGDN
jgi:intein-encoded DNA endonuclease-like protein